MCTNCLPHRDGHTPLPEPDSCHSSHSSNGTLPDFFHAPISRGQLLRMSGGGLAASLAGGSLGLKMLMAKGESLPYVVLIVLDGARRDYFNVPGIPHVRALIKNGTQYTNAFAGILESETPSGHTAIGTGSEPRVTGIPSFWWVNSENLKVDLFNPNKIRSGAMEKIIRKSGAPTLAGLVHGKNRKAAVVALSGSKYYAADAIGGPDADVTMYFAGTAKGQFAPTYIPGHAPPAAVLNSPGLTAKTTNSALSVENHLAMALAVKTFRHMKQQVTLINLPEFDWPLGHVNGGIVDPARVKILMQAFDRDLAMLQDAYRKAGVLDRTIFVLAADHGMMPLVHKVPKNEITDAVAKAGTAIIADAYTSGAYLWLKDASRVRTAAQNLANLHHPYIQSVYASTHTSKGYVYQRVTSAKLLSTGGTEAANQYLLQSFNGANRPDVVVFFIEGVGSEPGGQAQWKADHGGASWEAQHLPLIFSGPGVRSGQTSSHPARLIDIAPTVLQLMGISPSRMQGIPLADAMQSPPSGAGWRQQAIGKNLHPLARALQHESRSGR